MTLAYMRVDQTIISVLGERFELAEYAVAAQLAEQAYTLPIILNAVFVGRIGALQMASDPVKLQIAMSQLYRWGFVAACLLSAFAAGIAHLLVPAIYGEKYRASSTLFMILILAVPFVTLGSLQSLAILTGNYPSIQLKKTALAAFLSVPAGLLGWTLFRLHGLALSVLLVQVFACFLANWLFDRTAFQTQLSAVLHLPRYKQPLRR